MEESIIKELSKKFEAVSLTNLGRRGAKGKEAFRCVWCDNFEHSRKECVDLQDEIRKNVVYLDDNMIHSIEIQKSLQAYIKKLKDILMLMTLQLEQGVWNGGSSRVERFSGLGFRV